MKVFKQSEIEELANIINNDGILAVPTDTVYGISCNSFSESAIKKIYSAKKRSLDKPICVLTNNIDTKSNQTTSFNRFVNNLEANKISMKNISNRRKIFDIFIYYLGIFFFLLLL